MTSDVLCPCSSLARGDVVAKGTDHFESRLVGGKIGSNLKSVNRPQIPAQFCKSSVREAQMLFLDFPHVCLSLARRLNDCLINSQNSPTKSATNNLSLSRASYDVTSQTFNLFSIRSYNVYVDRMTRSGSHVVFNTN